ncbi:MAG: SpoIID/LytB domain-containing protein [Lachnospiraceae bacterium]|nr:SpoIID/LytB domain-containing protein [Lachnospiraceae bacterium]
MKKLAAIAFSAIGLTALFMFNSTVFAYNLPQKIRVGLEYKYKEVETVPVSNSKIEIGIENNEEFYGEAEISGKSGFAVAMPSGKTVDANEFYGNYEDAISASEDLSDMWGYDAVPAYVGKKLWGIYICGVADGEAKYVADDVTGSVITTNNLMVLKDGSRVIMAFNEINPQIAPVGSTETVTLNDRSYRGIIEFGRYNGSKITAVNVVDLDDYLYGVVPSEMPSSWEKEALKAQAVAARSYAVTSMSVHIKSGYNVCDNTNCQVYMGYGQEKASTNLAVDETSGIAAYYNGQPINAVFCSSSGGSTDDAGNVWAYDIPYLKAVPEINEEGVSTWTRTFTAEQLKTILAGKGINVGNIKNVEITSVGAYGRVQAITITGNSGTKVLTKEETRTIFSGTAEGSLKSRLYTINGKGGVNITNSTTTANSTVSVQNSDSVTKINLENSYVLGSGGNSILGSKISSPYAISGGNEVSAIETNSTTTTNNFSTYSGSISADTFVFTGKGLGHGVGMSQYGANGMAKQGYTYKEILKHYYTGITVE